MTATLLAGNKEQDIVLTAEGYPHPKPSSSFMLLFGLFMLLFQTQPSTPRRWTYKCSLHLTIPLLRHNYSSTRHNTAPSGHLKGISKTSPKYLSVNPCQTNSFTFEMRFLLSTLVWALLMVASCDGYPQAVVIQSRINVSLLRVNFLSATMVYSWQEYKPETGDDVPWVNPEGLVAGTPTFVHFNVSNRKYSSKDLEKSNHPFFIFFSLHVTLLILSQATVALYSHYLQTRYVPVDSILLSRLPQNVVFPGIEWTMYYTTDNRTSTYRTDTLRLCNFQCGSMQGNNQNNINIPDTAEGENATFVRGSPTVGPNFWALCVLQKKIPVSC